MHFIPARVLSGFTFSALMLTARRMRSRADSDYDFYVVLRDSAENPLSAVGDMYTNLRSIKNRKTPVDILAGYKTHFDERARFLTLEKKIKNEGLVLYDRS